MNFLKISGLVIGTGSVLGGTGAGVYYGVSKNNDKKENFESKTDIEANKKIEFLGKLVFIKKTNDNNSSNYTVEVFTESEYKNKSETFNSNKKEGEKYENINKIISISDKLRFEDSKNKLKEIFGEEISLEEIREKIKSEKEKIAKLFDEVFYENLKKIFNTV